MRFMKIKYLILFSLLAVFPTVLAGVDVNDIYIQGDSTLIGMKIESSYFANGAFLIETTGARFEYAKGDLKIFQGLDKTNRRLLSTITFDDEPNFVKVEANEDHILFWSQDINLGFYGDSTCIISPKIKQQLKCKGNFKPDYEGRYKGELLLIDDFGGMEIYPQRYEAGYELERIELGKKDWVVEYLLNPNERVMVAAFPGREFDWEKSFKSNFMLTTGGLKNTDGYIFGEMPSESIIKYWSKYFNIIGLHWNGLWRSNKPRPHGPYIVDNGPELRRLVKTAHKLNMKVIVHCSLFYFYRMHRDIESFFHQINTVHEEFDTDGVYIDGLMFDASYINIDNKIANWEMVRRLRQLFGNNGVIIYHGTSLGTPVATVPNIDSYCDATLNGEGVQFNSVDDLYVKYQVRKYGISNTIAMWRPDGPHPGSIGYKDIVDTIIRMNGRHLYEAYVFKHKYTPSLEYKYYFELFQQLKQKYVATKELNPNQRN